MHAVYELKEKLCEELEEYGQKRELSAGSLDIIDKLAHTIKNLNKILESYEETSGHSYGGYSYRNSRRGNSMRGGRGYSNDYSNGYSGARYGMPGGGRVRYSGNGYSRAEDITEKLQGLMDDAQDERTRQEIQNLIYRIEGM